MISLGERYTSLKLLDYGGMAKVYLARDESDQTLVAVKVLEISPKHDYVNKKRFVNEIKLTRAIRSPFVVSIKDFYYAPELQFFVMEYLSGETLKQRIVRKTKLSEKETVHIARQIALGLESIHQAGIIHRDIKPQNIMVMPKQRIKIIDLGIAKNDTTGQLTKTGVIIASIHYVAPEVLRLETPTPQVDIYALGMLIYYMVMGRVAFNDETDTAIISKHEKAELPALETLSEPLAKIIKRATAKNPQRRYASALDLFYALDNLAI